MRGHIALIATSLHFPPRFVPMILETQRVRSWEDPAMLMARVGLGVALAGLLVLADPVCGQGEDVKSEQRVLRDAGLPTDGPGLVNFLRKQIPSKVDEVRIASIVERLGDKSFAAREKA